MAYIAIGALAIAALISASIIVGLIGSCHQHPLALGRCSAVACTPFATVIYASAPAAGPTFVLAAAAARVLTVGSMPYLKLAAALRVSCVGTYFGPRGWSAYAVRFASAAVTTSVDSLTGPDTTVNIYITVTPVISAAVDISNAGFDPGLSDRSAWV
jgi:hypothetical protein